MKLAEQWTGVLQRLPTEWESARLTLSLADEEGANRAALILGPAAPGRAGRSFRLALDRRGRTGLGASPALVGRVLARLDEEDVEGELELVDVESRPERSEAVADVDVQSYPATAGGLAAQWDALLETLPPDWSHLYAEVTLDSTDYVERGALLMSPTNPALFGGARGLRFRCSHAVGYGVSVGMARRCLERLDRDGITGRLRVVRVVSDARPVYTQGPVWYVGGRSV
ncbi:MAG: hypothetical protein KY396_09055 [Actinobacteria bacterium]|nr:hypothetical protein [Actinomycetota bacterium]